jgi:ribosomal protein L32
MYNQDERHSRARRRMRGSRPPDAAAAAKMLDIRAGPRHIVSD